jgi:hypothetical protein
MRSNHGNYHNRNSDTIWGFFVAIIVIIGITAAVILYNSDNSKLKDKIIEGQQTYTAEQELRIKSLLDTITKLKSTPIRVDTFFIKPPVKHKILPLDTIKPIASDSIYDTIRDSLKH